MLEVAAPFAFDLSEQGRRDFLVGDLDRGPAAASVLGLRELLEPHQERVGRGGWPGSIPVASELHLGIGSSFGAVPVGSEGDTGRGRCWGCQRVLVPLMCSPSSLHVSPQHEEVDGEEQKFSRPGETGPSLPPHRPHGSLRTYCQTWPQAPAARAAHPVYTQRTGGRTTSSTGSRPLEGSLLEVHFRKLFSGINRVRLRSFLPDPSSSK